MPKHPAVILAARISPDWWSIDASGTFRAL